MDWKEFFKTNWLFNTIVVVIMTSVTCVWPKFFNGVIINGEPCGLAWLVGFALFMGLFIGVQKAIGERNGITDFFTGLMISISGLTGIIIGIFIINLFLLNTTITIS